MEYFGQFVGYLEERNLSPNTIKVYRNNLLEFKNFIEAGKSQFSIRAIKRKEIRDFLFSLSEKNNQPITRRAKLITIRSFFRFLEDENIIGSNPTKNIPLPKVARKEPAYLSEAEIKKLLLKAKRSSRAEVAIRILIETGIRLSELTNLDVGNIDTESQTIRLRRKGDIEQIMPINHGLARLIKSFVKGRFIAEPLIANWMGERMTPRRVAIMIKDCLEKAKIDRAGISVHSFRHSFCVRLLQKKVDLRTIQILCNHASITTTERYLHIANPELRAGMKMAEIN